MFELIAFNFLCFHVVFFCSWHLRPSTSTYNCYPSVPPWWPSGASSCSSESPKDRSPSTVWPQSSWLSKYVWSQSLPRPSSSLSLADSTAFPVQQYSDRWIEETVSKLHSLSVQISFPFSPMRKELRVGFELIRFDLIQQFHICCAV